MLVDQVIAGKYRITELIGQGGMGTVFEAVHTGTNSRVAIKVIVSKDVKAEVFVRFQREARAAGTIDSRHIVRVFDMGTDDRTGSPYMVMERLVGEDLSQLMRRVGPLSIENALQILHQAALGLSKAHEQGVVHRDVKPANLFLHDGEQGESVVKILDFGIAKVRMDLLQKAEEGGLTRTGSMLGSPHYMSPEQAQGLRSIDHRSDIWSLGIVLYKMLTGQTPHAKSSTLGQVILAICSKAPAPVQELAPWIPPEIAFIVHRALQPDPAHRFQSALELAQAIEPFIANAPPLRRREIAALTDEQRAQHAVSFHPRESVSTHGSTHHGLVQTPTETPRRSGASGLAWLIAGSFVFAVALGAGAVVLTKKSNAAATTPHVEPVAVADPKALTSAAPPSAPEPPAPKVEDRKATVSVPATATVEIDGKKVAVEGGKIELTGPLGSVQSVHVVTSNGETTQNVAITEGGALPAKITVSKTPRGGKVGPGTTPVPSTGVNVQRKFE